MDMLWLILSFFVVFASGVCVGIVATVYIMPQYPLWEAQNGAELPQGGLKNTFFAEKKAERPDVKKAYKYSRPEYRSEMEDNLGFSVKRGDREDD